MNNTQEPQGIGFYSVKSGDTHYAKLEPTIQAYVNSSDMGINASRGQDFGWRLDKEWVQKVKDFRRDQLQMQMLTARNGGQKPTTVQILYFLYGEQMRSYQEQLEENENPYEQQYQDDISGRTAAPAVAPAPAPSANDEDDMSDLIDEVIAEDEPVKPEVQKAPEGADTKVEVKDGQVKAPKTDGKTSIGKAKQ